MKTYCKSCGSPNEYIGVKPKTCIDCGESLEAKLPITTKKAPVVKNTEEDYIPNKFSHLNLDAKSFGLNIESIIEKLKPKSVKLDLNADGKIDEIEDDGE